MWYLKEFVPEGIKDYCKLVGAKLRFPGCFIGSPLIGRGVRLGRGCLIGRHAEVGDNVEMGDYSYLNTGAVAAAGVIGRYCSIGPYAMIGLPEHPLDFLSTSPMLYGQQNLLHAPPAWSDFASPPRIGSDVWIGAFAVVLQAVSVGDGAVIGAGAVVTRDVEPYQIVAGVPARPLRHRFGPERVKELLREPWWERSTSELPAMKNRFLRPEYRWTEERLEEVLS